MSYPIEVLGLGEENVYDDIVATSKLLNGVQSEFIFTAAPDRMRGDGAMFPANRQGEYLTTDAFDFLRKYRVLAKGYRPFLLAITTHRLRSAKWGNLFGSHEAQEGLAIVSLHAHEFFTRSRLQYLCYSFIRYSLSFIHPDIRAHEGETDKDCFFHFKRDKRHLILAIKTGNICPDCKRVLNERLSIEDHRAIRAMIECMKNPPLERRADVAIITIVTEETVGVRKRLMGEAANFRETTGSLSERIYYEGRLKAAGSSYHQVVCTQSLKQGNRPMAAAYDHVTTEYLPRLVILFGIAGAIHRSMDVCDALFAESIIYYDSRKVTPNGTLHRGQGYNIVPWLQTFINAYFVHHGGEPAVLTAVPGSKHDKFRVHKGPLGAGEAVVADNSSEIREWLTRVNDKTLALETEAGGLAEVFEESQLNRGYKADGYLVVRGISDHADHAKGDDYRQVCVDNAMIALEQLLEIIPITSTAD